MDDRRGTGASPGGGGAQAAVGGRGRTGPEHADEDETRIWWQELLSDAIRHEDPVGVILAWSEIDPSVDGEEIARDLKV